jgi:hypothetical protein
MYISKIEVPPMELLLPKHSKRRKTGRRNKKADKNRLLYREFEFTVREWAFSHRFTTFCTSTTPPNKSQLATDTG